MSEQERTSTSKNNVDIVALVKSRGIRLKKNGVSYFGTCPFHDGDQGSLSVNPRTNTWLCFACGSGGNVVRFVEMYDRVTTQQALQTLDAIDDSKLLRKDVSLQTLTIRERRLLERVASYYLHSLTEDTKIQEKIKERCCINEIRTLADFNAGYVNGTLCSILSEDPDVIGSLKNIGILNGKGKETFLNCLVVPLYDNEGSIINLFGWHMDDNTQVFLPGNRSGIINKQAAKRAYRPILTPYIIDALVLYDRGFSDVIPLWGSNGFTEDILHLLKERSKSVSLVCGKEEPESITSGLKANGIDACPVVVPYASLTEYFTHHTPDVFRTLLGRSVPVSSGKLRSKSQTFFNHTDGGFVVGYENRQYQVKGFQRGSIHLKATVKVSKDVGGNEPFELTTVDFYSSRSRSYFTKVCANLFETVEENILEDVNCLLTLVETYKPDKEKVESQEPSEADKKAALAFLQNPEMLDEILNDIDVVGVTGEETNKLVSYLAAVSRKLDDPLSVLIQSRSAAGKSTLQDAILSLVPDEDFIKYTRITDQALFYKDEDSLVNKILAIEEEVGMGGAAYSIRNIQSAKKITVAATGKDHGTGKMKTEEYTVKGPVSVMVTTTAAELEGETASRFLFLTIDESNEMTEAIHRKQRESETLQGLIRRKRSESVIAKHHTAQRMMKPLQVVNPFAEYLSYPSGTIRTRRDHKKYLGLIRAVAYLFQFQREVKSVDVECTTMEYIEVTLDDIEKANKLANEVLGQCLDDLAKPSRTLLDGIFNMVKERSKADQKTIDEISFSRRMIREYTGWTDWQIRAHIKQLVDLEYIVARTGSKGKEYSYALGFTGEAVENNRHYLNLTTVEDIKRRMAQCKAS